MEKIDLNNYEAYFLDYMEGTLSAEEKHDLFAFLKLHPALKAEMEEDFGMVELEPENLSFGELEALKFDERILVITPQTAEEIMIASIEGQLSTEQQTQLDDYIKANNLGEQFAYYKATKLKADLSITYKESELLKTETDKALFLTEETVEQLMIAAVEGELTTAHKNDLLAYIKTNQLEKQFEYYNATVLKADESLTFSDKAVLKSTAMLALNTNVISAENVEEKMIAAVENQLSTTETKNLEAYIKANNLEKKWAYYNATVLTADTSIVYADKSKLKVKTGIITMPFIARAASIAAVGIILISFGMKYWGAGESTINDEIGNSAQFATEVRDSKSLELFKTRLNNKGTVMPLFNTIDNNAPFNNSTNQQEVNQIIESINSNDIANIDTEDNLPEIDSDTTSAPIINPDNSEDLNPSDFVEDNSPTDINKEEFPFELPKEELPEEDVVYASAKTEEPYKIVTDAAENLVKRDIQFTREKDQNTNKYVGYSFKLGKFEFERKKSR